QEADGIERQRKGSAKDRTAESPQGDGCRTEQIGGAPPSQGRNVLLPAERQQHGAEHRGNQGRHEIKGGSVEYHEPPRWWWCRDRRAAETRLQARRLRL